MKYLFLALVAASMFTLVGCADQPTRTTTTTTNDQQTWQATNDK